MHLVEVFGEVAHLSPEVGGLGGYLMVIVSALLSLLLTTSSGEITQDSSYTLRYSLPVGTSYTYKVTTDQFVIRNAGVRLHTAITMDVVGHDENANAICRFKLRSDTVEDNDDKFIYRPIGSLNFAGHRLYAEAGHVELVLDPLGNLVDNTPTEEDMNKMPEVVTQFQRTVDANVNDPDMMGEGGSYMLNLVLPAAPHNLSLNLHQAYADTVMFESRAVHLPTVYGTQALAASNNNGAIPENRRLLLDTLYRMTILDSVRTVNGQIIGYMTFKNTRINALGSHYTSVTEVERDMTSGLIQHIREKCYRVNDDEERITYYAKAELVSAVPIAKVQH